MAVARSRGRLKGKQPKLSARQQAELVRMRSTGEYTIADLMEVFSVGRATVYRVLDRARLDGRAAALQALRESARTPLPAVARSYVTATGRRY